MFSGNRCENRDNVLRTVEIHLTSEKSIFLHSSFLILCSGYFATSLDKAWVDRSGLELEDDAVVYILSLEDDPTGDFLVPQVYQAPHVYL
jgi:hypothetical protein